MSLVSVTGPDLVVMSRKILILRKGYNLAKDKWNKLAEANHVDLVQVESKSAEEYIDLLKQNDVVAIANTVPGTLKFGGYNDDIYAALKGVGCIAHQGAGYDVLDATKLHKLGIQVSNTPDAVITGTADTAIYLMLGALRNFGGLASSLRKGKWSGDLPLADEAEGKTLGILGLGGIGAAVRDKARDLFEFDKIQYHNRHRAYPSIEQDSEYVVDFDTFLKTSDVIYLSIPLNDATHHLIDAEALKKCKDGVYIINTARGPVVDEQALVDALESGKVKSVGLDVYEFEPKIHPGLVANENTMLLPHAGTHTVVSRRKMEEQVIDNIESFLKNGKVENLVPECRS